MDAEVTATELQEPLVRGVRMYRDVPQLRELGGSSSYWELPAGTSFTSR